MKVTAQEFYDWLAEHDIDYRQVKHVEFVPEGVGRGDRVQMRVIRFALNEEGKRFFDREQTRRTGEQKAAEETIFVPLKSLPGRPRPRTRNVVLAP